MVTVKTIKKTLPFVVFIILGAGAVGLSLPWNGPGILIGGLGAACMAALLFYAVINWDDALEHNKRETRQLASVVNHAMDAILIADASGAVLYANPAARQAYGLHHYRRRPHTVDVIGLSRPLRDTIHEQVLGGEPWNGELQHRTPDGAVRTCLANIFRLETFQGHAPAVVCVVRDLTERKSLERQLRHSHKLAAVGELAAGVAHEINNPMAAIQTQIGLAQDLLQLARPAPADEQEILDCIKEADQQVQRCSRIIDSLLRFSRSHGEPQLMDIPLEPAVKQALNLIRSLPRMKRVQVICDGGTDCPLVRSDADSISQILVNLIVNAADAIDHAGEVRVRLHRTAEGSVAIDVIDHGPGIDPAVLERVFEPFYTTKPPGAGTGLGLSVSYAMAQSIGAELTLASTPHSGSCATLTLPAASSAST